MREKPLSRIGDELARLRDDVMPERPAPPAGFGIDEALVSRFAGGELSGQPEADLGGQVARVLPCHWSQSNTYALLMTHVMDHLGGHWRLVTWLDRFPACRGSPPGSTSSWASSTGTARTAP
ncbi:hypothetical protein ACPCKV_18370 [Streptomyces koyangensis]|uniref:hypothetical protein n=1 Tax=Streptomyces koyangensis TaxID=188770 RepID=UPI003C2B4E13